MNIIKVSATGNFDMAIKLTDEYLSQLEREKHNAEQAIQIVNELLNGESSPNQVLLKRKEVSEFLGITMDTLRELNGLLCVKRKANGYRVYSNDDIKRLRIIKALRCANYSLSSILRMLNALSVNPDINIKSVIGMPEENEDIITACDKLLLSLNDASENARFMKATLINMKKSF